MEQTTIPATWNGTRHAFFARYPKATYRDYERARKQYRADAKARKVARNRDGYAARLQAHMSTDSATFAALNGVTA